MNSTLREWDVNCWHIRIPCKLFDPNYNLDMLFIKKAPARLSA